MKTRNSAAMLLFALMAFAVLIGETKAARMKRIIGGSPAMYNTFSYIVSIARLNTTKHQCNGAIISPRHIITSASCLEPHGKVAIYSGKYNPTIKTAGKMTVEKSRHVHKHYNQFADCLKNGYDVAIVELVEELVIDNVNTKVISLAYKGPEPKVSYTVSSFGDIKYGSQPMWNNLILQIATVEYLDDKTCSNMGGNPKYAEKLCVSGFAGGRVDLGEGDRGAPLVNLDGKLMGVGACSSRGKNTPHFYTRVVPISTWITETIMLPSKQTYPIDLQKSARPRPSKARG